MRGCWNRQTGTFEVRVSYGVGVQVPSLAPEGSHKIDAPTETPDFIGGFAIFLVKKSKGEMTDENRLFRHIRGI